MCGSLSWRGPRRPDTAGNPIGYFLHVKTPRPWQLIGIAAVVVVALVAVWFQWNNRPRIIPAVDSAALREAITTEDLMAHIRELERIADANDGNRQAGTPGHEASMAYVEAQLKEAGYETRRISYEGLSCSQRRLVGEYASLKGQTDNRYRHHHKTHSRRNTEISNRAQGHYNCRIELFVITLPPHP